MFIVNFISYSVGFVFCVVWHARKMSSPHAGMRNTTRHAHTHTHTPILCGVYYTIHKCIGRWAYTTSVLHTLCGTRHNVGQRTITMKCQWRWDLAKHYDYVHVLTHTLTHTHTHNAPKHDTINSIHSVAHSIHIQHSAPPCDVCALFLFWCLYLSLYGLCAYASICMWVCECVNEWMYFFLFLTARYTLAYDEPYVGHIWWD